MRFLSFRRRKNGRGISPLLQTAVRRRTPEAESLPQNLPGECPTSRSGRESTLFQEKRPSRPFGAVLNPSGSQSFIQMTKSGFVRPCTPFCCPILLWLDADNAVVFQNGKM